MRGRRNTGPRGALVASPVTSPVVADSTATVAVVPVEWLEVPEGWDYDRVRDICALYLAGKPVDDTARVLNVSLSTVYAVIRRARTVMGMTVYELRHELDKELAAEAQYKAGLSGWKLVCKKAKQGDAAGVQKAAYGASQASQVWLDYTEGRVSSRPGRN